MGQIGHKWDKSGNFSDQIQYILAHPNLVTVMGGHIIMQLDFDGSWIVYIFFLCRTATIMAMLLADLKCLERFSRSSLEWRSVIGHSRITTIFSLDAGGIGVDIY